MNWIYILIIIAILTYNLYRTKETWKPIIKNQWLIVKTSYKIMRGKK